MHNPFDPNASLDIARAQIRRQANEALIKGAFFLGLMGLLGAAQVGILILLGKPGFELPLGFSLCGAAMGFTIMMLAKLELMDGVVKYVACLIFVSMPTGFLLTSHAVMPGGAATFINGPMPYIYFMLLAMTAFLFDARLTIVCGVVVAAGYLFAAHLAIPQLSLLSSPDPITQQDLRDPPIYWIKSFMLFFMSLILAALSTIARRIILSTVQKAYERGSYKLVARLGHGGMGEVWVAEHKMLARRAAVKLIRTETLGSQSDHKTLQRFEREAQATSKLRSPHTIEIYDFGLADDGTFYYVMELLTGLDLETLIARHGPQPAERVIYLLRQICASLDEAHRSQLVHRDIKPANIFVCRYGIELDFVKVLDFGLVKDSTQRADSAPGVLVDGDARLTRNVAVGTPAYMPPEVLEGQVDARADIYALGCVAYWMLTGALVFEAANSTDMVIAHVHETPVAPSLRTELEVPKVLEQLILRCLAKDPDRRPQSAGEILATLSSPALTANWGPTRMDRWWQMHAPQVG